MNGTSCYKLLITLFFYYLCVQDIQRLERLLYIQGVPMALGDASLIVCKLCRYYANLLLRPLEDKPQKINFIKTYSKR